MIRKRHWKWLLESRQPALASVRFYRNEWNPDASECRPLGVHHRSSFSRRTSKSGYILMMVLVLLIVLATALTSIATRSMQTTHEAVAAVAQLQQRVGITSCRDTLLEKSIFVFKGIDARRLNGYAPPSDEANFMVSDSLILGGQRFDLVLSDENSKVNLNAVNFNSGQQRVYRTLQRTLPVNYMRAISLQPASNANRSNDLSSSESAGASRKQNRSQGDSGGAGANAGGTEEVGSSDTVMIPAFRSWGEIFDFGALINQSPNGDAPLEFTKTFTLWGSGQLNVIRAPDSSILTQLESAIPAATAKKILQAIKKSRDFDVQTIVEAEVQSAKQRKQLRSLIGKESYTFSLFVDVKAPQARSRKLFTLSPDINGTQEIQEFVFH